MESCPLPALAKLSVLETALAMEPARLRPGTCTPSCMAPVAEPCETPGRERSTETGAKPEGNGGMAPNGQTSNGWR